MANDIEYVGDVQPAADRSWLFDEIANPIPITLDLSKFTDDALFQDAGNSSTGFIHSGIPLGLITATGQYGPADKGASDGRATVVGVLADPVKVTFGRKGMTASDAAAALEYNAVIKVANLPVKAEGAAVKGAVLYDFEDGKTPVLLTAMPGGSTPSGH